MSRSLAIPRKTAAAAFAVAIALCFESLHAGTLDDVGVNDLRSVQPILDGSGIIVAMPEASEHYDIHGNSLNQFELNPAALNPAITITYTNSSGNTTTSFPNIGIGVGTESSHADAVGLALAGTGPGVAPGITSIYSYEAGYFVNNVIVPVVVSPPNFKIINQSFGFADYTNADLINQYYDNFVNNHNSILISALAGGPSTTNPPGTMVVPPGTAYNGLTVNEYSQSGTFGTPDGRSKVDISAPGGGHSSFAAPIVSGVAALLVQAGTLGLGGAGTTTSAVDNRVIRSLLLDGATKPSGWTHTATDPLDHQYGAGIVNAFASYKILTAGKATPSLHNDLVPIGNPHSAAATSASVLAVGNTGWSLQNNASISNASGKINSNSTASAIDHYILNLSPNGKSYVFTATLTWNRPTDSQANINNNVFSGINNLDLFLYNGSSQISASTSTVDNVQQIYFPNLTPGQYDLQVFKQGGAVGSAGVVSNSETYSLAWSSPLFGDTNWDGVVDIVDLTNVANNWQTNQRGVFNGDTNGDGVVDIQDFTDVANNWQSGTGTPTSAAPTLESLGITTTPEPTTLILMSAGTAAMMIRRRRSPSKT